MFDVSGIVRIDPYMPQPWEVPCERRLCHMIRSKADGKKTVVYLYEEADRSTFRYRGYNMCQVLSESSDWHGVYFFADELERVYKYIDLMDIVIIIRFRWSGALDSFINELKRKRKRILFDVDDLIYDVRYLPTVINTLAEDLSDPGLYDYWFAYISRLFLAADSCEAFISTNEYIASRLRQDFGRTCYIMPNFLNREQEDISRSLWEQKQRTGAKKPFMIGYFSGSPSHQNDFATIAEEVKDLLREFHDIKLKIVGFMGLSAEFELLKQQGKVLLVPLKHFRELQAEIAEVDVNLVPLLDNDFTNCKSELKFFEAGIVGTVTCAVPTYTYRNIIVPGVNGYLCGPGEWYPTIKELYLNGIDQKVVEQAKILSENRFGWRGQLQRLNAMLNSILEQLPRN